MAKITRERAERIARSHACENCREYSYKKLKVTPASPSHRKQFQEAWHVVLVCGVCGVKDRSRTTTVGRAPICFRCPLVRRLAGLPTGP